MKKLIAMLLALVLVMGLVACGNTETPETTPAATEDTTVPAPTEEIITEDTLAATEPVEVAEPNEATEKLTAIWDAVEGEKFFAMGGDMNNMVDGAPGNYSLEDEGLTAMLYVPADQIANLSAASSLMHGMLANNFTCGMYKMAEGADAQAFAEAMKAAIESAQWICGMPEKMVIATIDGEYVLACFGINDAIAPFETALTTTYADAEIVCSAAIAG